MGSAGTVYWSMYVVFLAPQSQGGWTSTEVEQASQWNQEEATRPFLTKPQKHYLCSTPLVANES